MTARRFVLQRDEDVSGMSGTGLVCEGVEFSDGVVALRWIGEWPTTVCHYDRGVASVEALHGHGGRTRIVWLDEPPEPAVTAYGVPADPAHDVRGAEVDAILAADDAEVLADYAVDYLAKLTGPDGRLLPSWTPTEVAQLAARWSVDGWQAIGRLAGKHGVSASLARAALAELEARAQ